MGKRLFSFVIAFFVLFAAPPLAEAEYSAGVSARAAILLEATTGQVLYVKEGDTRLAMASTTKIMTALLTLEQPNLDEYFVVDSEAIKVEGSSMGLVEGDQVTLRALASGMLLPSGNDAANAAAVKIAGSVDAFVALMNERAEKMGLSNTHFVTPSGLDAEGHYSTAADMAKLAGEAIKNPEFLAICSSPNLQLEYGNPPYKRWLKNSNKMLQTYEGAIGVKTGFTDEAGRCLVSAARRGGVTLIAVTLNDPNDWEDTKNLFDYGFSQVKAKEIPADFIGEQTITVTGGTKNECKIEAYGAATSVVDPELLTAKLVVEPFYYAPVTAGSIVGRVDYLHEGTVVATQPLMASETVERGITEPVDENIFQQFWNWLVGIYDGFIEWIHSFGQE